MPSGWKAVSLPARNGFITSSHDARAAGGLGVGALTLHWGAVKLVALLGEAVGVSPCCFCFLCLEPVVYLHLWNVTSAEEQNHLRSVKARRNPFVMNAISNGYHRCRVMFTIALRGLYDVRRREKYHSRPQSISSPNRHISGELLGCYVFMGETLGSFHGEGG